MGRYPKASTFKVLSNFEWEAYKKILDASVELPEYRHFYEKIYHKLKEVIGL